MTMKRETMIPILTPVLAPAVALATRATLTASRNPSKKSIPPPLLLLLLLPAFACSGDGSPNASPHVDDDLQTRVIPDEAAKVAPPSDSIASIVDIALGADGTVWVMSTTEPFFVAMSLEGEVLDSRGRRGDGPGEFRTPSNLLQVGRPVQIWAYDSRAGKFARVDGPEDEIEELFFRRESGIRGASSISWEDSWDEWSSRRWIAGREDGFLFAHSAADDNFMGKMWDFEVAHLALDSSTSTVLSSGDLLGDPTVRYGEVGEISPVPVWAACPDGSMALYDPLANSVRRLARGGGERGSHALPPERSLNVTLERAFALMYRPMMAAMERPDGPQTQGFPTDSAALFEMFKNEVGDDLSETDLLPEYKHLACTGSDGPLWLQIFDVESQGRSLGDGLEWLRIGPDGAIQRIVFPESFSPLRFTEDRIWGSHRGDFDIESVAWIASPL